MNEIILYLIFVFFVANTIPFAITTFLGKKPLIYIFAGLQILLSVLLVMVAYRT